MKIDIQDIKFWMDGIRSTDDRDRLLECFWGGQLQSKEWLVEKLNKKAKIKNADIIVFGGWFGILSTMLLNSELGIRKIVSVDIDPKCEELARSMNKRYEMQGKFFAETMDMCEYDYLGMSNPYAVINTSCEHLTDAQYKKWFNNIPKNTKIVLQSNNYYEHEEHINCVSDINEFKRKSNLTTIEYEGELELPKYKRFMIIGLK